MDAGHPSQQVAEETEDSMLSVFPPVLSRPMSYDGRMISLTQHTQSTDPPERLEIRIVTGDPVKVALDYATDNGGIRVPFICAAHHCSPTRSQQGQSLTYEQRFCHRSNLLDTLTREWPGMDVTPIYPISETGGIFSERVAVYLGPREDNYKVLDPIPDLPVVSVPPVRKPSVKGKGSLYSKGKDKSTMKEKICGALRVCLNNNYNRVVIGDFGLGDGFLNPPQELAEIWWDLLLFDPNLRGQFKSVHFVFTDPLQSTSQWHRDELQRRNEEKWARQAATGGPASTSTKQRTEPLSSQPAPTDMEIFESVFHPNEIKRVREKAASSSSTNMVLS
ncbi:hypothetical protein E4U60_003745 [Claviceps pazoutovae]|uniref:Microbial-type PARG catalytic domain-containing protein n=1 Tax=Claviceps pazoutovae TaxID=1649127 RepID=A0A9P7MKT2_9HYPO|nr:hypothetical protein E4U60_003745 [Claviceps pazoutovae]